MHEGDYVLAINGQPLDANDNPYRLLRTAPGQLVQLTVNARASTDGARTVLVKPIDNEEPLNYFAWVKHNREYVEKASNGDDRLPAHPGHGRRRHPRVHQVVLSAAAQARASSSTCATTAAATCRR